MQKWDVVVTRRLPGEGMSLIEAGCRVRLWGEDRPIPRDKLLEMAAGVAGIVCLLSDPIDKEVMDAAGHGLKVISTMAVGFDNIDTREAAARGIRVGNTPGVLTEATADFTWALLLSAARRVVEGDRLMREGAWPGWSPTLLLGADFHGRALGIVGMGRIGQAVAKRAAGFGMNLIYHNRRRLTADRESALAARYVEMDELISTSDFVCLHCPLNDESHHLIGAAEFAKMKPEAYLVNVARGPVVDEKALVEALRERRIAGAALDVFENEPALEPGLAQLDNVVLAPHLGSASIETRNRMAVMAAQNLFAGLKNEPLPWPVNQTG